MRQSGTESSADIAGGTSTWDTSKEKLDSRFWAAWYTAIAVAGAVGLARPERDEEGRIDAPDYVRRLDSERRVKYEMDLLSRRQLSLLPDKPPVVPGLELSVKTILATVKVHYA